MKLSDKLNEEVSTVPVLLLKSTFRFSVALGQYDFEIKRKLSMWFAIKTLLAGLIIAYASWLSGRKPILAGFIVALPLVSMISILLSYLEYKDMSKINQFAISIVVAVPLSLSFFVPFILNRWLKLGFWPTYLLAIGFVGLAYLLHSWILKSH